MFPFSEKFYLLEEISTCFSKKFNFVLEFLVAGFIYNDLLALKKYKFLGTEYNFLEKGRAQKYEKIYFSKLFYVFTDKKYVQCR